ncbi:hypothetical protein EJB05_40460, partial [Eragrostis curvula]
MGKRKSAAKPPPKKRIDKLDTVFSCPFRNHGSSVECRIDMKNLIGEASRRICQENFSTTVNGMSKLHIELHTLVGANVEIGAAQRNMRSPGLELKTSG